MKLLFVVENTDSGVIGIVETSCYPCIYYAGYLTFDGGLASNDTHLFHRTIEEAIDAADAILKRNLTRLES